ncbi:MAG: hypothetical protein WBR26_19585 [Candidatus Acidiferrum sp.]
MSGEAADRAPMLNLVEVVERYAALARNFGDAVPLAGFGLNLTETQNLFSSLDEDYHISRFLHFSRAEGQSYTISGEPATHVSIDPSIRSML